MYCWGSTVHGELGLGAIPTEQVTLPQCNDFFKQFDILQIASGLTHTLILTANGHVYSCGNNEVGQLGHSKITHMSELVDSLECHHVMQVSAGDQHSAVMTTWGLVFTWGDNNFGQLGLNSSEHMLPLPKMVKGLAGKCVVQVACGSNHTLALTSDGNLYSWGCNNAGQLGLGHCNSPVRSPQIIKLLAGTPLAQIEGGGQHSVALTPAGFILTWGSNKYGQLGYSLGHNKIFSNKPTVIPNLAEYSEPLKFISVGENHTAVLDAYGKLWTFGLGRYGQLGHGTYSDGTVPKTVLDLVGSKVSQVACGRCHTLVYIPSQGQIYAFGQGMSGQLGVKTPKNRNLPQAVVGPWLSPSGRSILDSKSGNLPHVYAKHVFAGGDASFVSVSNSPGQSVDFCEELMLRQPFIVEESKINAMVSLHAEDMIDDDLFTYAEVIFNSLSCWSRSFMLENFSKVGHNFDFRKAEESFAKIGRIAKEAITEVIQTGFEKIVTELPVEPATVESLRCFLVLPLCHVFTDVKNMYRIHSLYAKALLNISSRFLDIYANWITLLPRDYMRRIISVYNAVVVHILGNPEGNTESKVICFCEFSFVFDAQAKTILLREDGMRQMQGAMEEARLTTNPIMFLLNPNEIQFLNLHIKRHNLIKDTIEQLVYRKANDLKLPLKVHFVGEEAEDAGGVRKEFFLLLLREILNPDYGMFTEYPETHTIWFREESLETDDMYELIGILCGLAIYNFTIINLPFPLVLYKKLLDESVSLDDLGDLDPSIIKSLHDLLEYDGDDVEDVFLLNFTVTHDYFGESKIIELKEKGANISVNSENRQEYVDLYVDYKLNKCIAKQYQAFAKAFHRVCGGGILKLFQPPELMALVTGNENYDWTELQKNTEYKGVFYSDHPTILLFWEVFHEICLEQKKKFLLFLTGSDRIPILGMKAIKMVIQAIADDSYLPVAHTCVAQLDLPVYNTKEKLRYKLLQAIQQSEGFGLV